VEPRGIFSNFYRKLCIRYPARRYCRLHAARLSLRDRETRVMLGRLLSTQRVCISRDPPEMRHFFHADFEGGREGRKGETSPRMRIRDAQRIGLSIRAIRAANPTARLALIMLINHSRQITGNVFLFIVSVSRAARSSGP